MTKYLMTVAIAAFCGSAAVTGMALTSVDSGAGADASGSKLAQPEPAMAPDHPLAAMFQGDPETMMAEWQAAATPGPAHAWLGQFVGSWKTTTSISMGAPEPMVSHGTSTIEWLIEGRFIVQHFEGEMMGMPMTGYGVTGFDNIKHMYVGTWLDSMGTGISLMQGSLDPTAKVQNMIGTMDEPTTGEHGKSILYVTTIIDEDHFRFEAKEILYGEPFAVVTIDYERAD